MNSTLTNGSTKKINVVPTEELRDQLKDEKEYFILIVSINVCNILKQ